MPDSICTPLGFVTGTVTVTGYPGHTTNAVAVVADNGSQRISTNVDPSPSPIPYTVPLSPGQWSVWAEFGPAKSEKQQINVKNGDSARIDFCFGK